jgi:hypothetical protein
MRKELAIKQIYDDFTSKITLTDNEKDILDRYIKNQTIIKIADETKQGTTTVSRVIADIKEKYSNYKKLELAKLVLLLGNK